MKNATVYNSYITRVSRKGKDYPHKRNPAHESSKLLKGVRDAVFYLASQSKTQTKKQLEVVQDVQHNNLYIDKSHIYMTKNRPKQHRRKHGDTILYQADVQSLIANSGVQGYHELWPIMTQSQMFTDNIVGFGGGNLTNWNQGIFNFEPNQTLLVTDTHSAGKVPMKYAYVRYIEYEYTIKNGTTIPAEYNLYMYTPYKNINSSPNTVATSFQNYEQGLQVATHTTFGGSAGAQGEIVNGTFFNVNLHDHKIFREQYKIKNTHHFVLQPGAQYRLKFIIHYNKLFSRNQIGNQYVTQYIAGVTLFPYLRVKPGILYHNAVAPSQPVVGICQTEVHGSMKVHIRYPKIEDQVQQVWGGDTPALTGYVQANTIQINDIDATSVMKTES